ncbi:MAG TPA: UDP-N-acetylmuramate dehydrogenase [bacterium]|nr:UDP-N-acetylmuramate dehydrogenase [bacterium]
MMDKIRIIQKIKQRFKGSLLADEPLSGHTSYRIGGPADLFALPGDLDDVRLLLDICHAESLDWFVIGRGSNLLVSDTGFRGIVIDVSDAFNHISSRGTVVTAGAGVLLWDLLRYCTEFGLSGLEELSGVPGSLGGAVRLNAGAFGEEIFNTISRIKFLDPTGIVEKRERAEIRAGYRQTDLPRRIVVIEAELTLHDGNPTEMQAVQDNILKRRRERQPLSLPSAGSVFKRPEGDYAGRLIEEAGLKGLRIGDAMVSKKHANFIVNVHVASARDVLHLIREVQERVFERFGVRLEPEIHFVGFEETVP